MRLPFCRYESPLAVNKNLSTNPSILLHLPNVMIGGLGLSETAQTALFEKRFINTEN